MKKRISVFFLYLVYWYVLFVLVRAVFLITYFHKTMQLPVSEIFNTFIYGFKLDIAIASYIALLPSLFLVVSSFFKGRFIKYFYNIYSAIALLFVTVIIVGDLFMYRFWGFRLDATPLFYMTNLKAMTASVSMFTFIGAIMAVVIVSALLFFIYLKLFGELLGSLKKDYTSAAILIPATLLLLVVMRGGISGSSLSTSSAYFSKNQFANHAAINPVWNVGFSISE